MATLAELQQVQRMLGQKSEQYVAERKEVERLRDTLRKVLNHPLTHLSGDMEILVNQALNK